MLYSDRFAVDEEYRRRSFHTCPADRPLIAQFAATTPHLLFAAASHLLPHVDCLDLNLGCPQSHALSGGYGAALLDRRHWPLVRRLVRCLLPLGLPVSVKLRILPSLPLTLSLLSLLADAGVSAVAIHGRTRGSPKRRRQGAANLAHLTACVHHLRHHHPRVLCFVNGNTRWWVDVEANLRVTGADGVMVGEALLANPRVFRGWQVRLHGYAVGGLEALWRGWMEGGGGEVGDGGRVGAGVFGEGRDGGRGGVELGVRPHVELRAVRGAVGRGDGGAGEGGAAVRR